MGKAPFALCFVLAFASAAAAQAPGDEFQVNSTFSPGLWSAVAADPQGRFVVAWKSSGSMVGRLFDAAGMAQGPDFVISTGPIATSPFSAPSVSYEANGGFVVAWPGASTPPLGTVVARRYDAVGVPRGPEFPVAATGTQVFSPCVSAGAGGGFVVTWSDPAAGGSILARLFDAAGLGGAIIPVASGVGAHSYCPPVTMTPDGGFVVAWKPDSGFTPLSARLFDAAGVPRGPAFDVDTAALSRARVSSDGAGNFTVSWWGGNSFEKHPFIRRYSASGSPLGPRMAMNTHQTGFQHKPDVAMASTGGTVVVWESAPINGNCPPPPNPCIPPPPQDGDASGIFGRRLDVAGNVIGGEFAVNTYTTGGQYYPAVAMDAGGRAIVVWNDGHRDGIYGRRVSALVPSAMVVDVSPSGASNGNGVFEVGETASVEPSWLNTSGVAQSFTGANATLSGPSGPVYAMPDGSASYGTLPAGATTSCSTALDCYSASISGTRLVGHWDAVMSEAFVPAGYAATSWKIHVGESFSDVPIASPYYRFVETLLHQGVTSGCGGGVYCPTQSVLREQMPVFLLEALEPRSFYGYCTQGHTTFADVPASSPYCPWIQELARRGVVSGCGGGNYCPTQPVTRETMAVYIGASLSLNPPSCLTPMFTDVPAFSPYCRWIEELARRGVVGGCGAGLYCPTAPVSREQMAVFLTASFGLRLYGP